MCLDPTNGVEDVARPTEVDMKRVLVLLALVAALAVPAVSQGAQAPQHPNAYWATYHW